MFIKLVLIIIYKKLENNIWDKHILKKYIIKARYINGYKNDDLIENPVEIQKILRKQINNIV